MQTNRIRRRVSWRGQKTAEPYERFYTQLETCVFNFNLSIPRLNIGKAPVSLAGALQEYLDDPNFEQNRIEYKTGKTASGHIANNPASKTKPSEGERGLIIHSQGSHSSISSTTKTGPCKYFNAAKCFHRSKELHPR